MKVNLYSPVENPRPVTFTGHGFRPGLSTNDGERGQIAAAQLRIDFIRTGVTRQ